MAKAKKAAVPVPHQDEAADAPAAGDGLYALQERVAELEGDLARVVELLIKGDLDSAKFREILSKRQGAAKA